MASVSFYQTLQIAPDATQAEISAAYRRLARQVHPDLNPSPDAHRQMQVLNEAYNTLRHPERRRRYDEQFVKPRSASGGGSTAGAGGATQAASRPAASATTRAHHTGAWLSYQKRIGDEIVFTIGHADNMPELLIELQRRIPPSDRSYDISQNRWRVHVAHADVLRALFRNYAPVVQQPAAHMAASGKSARPVSPRRKAGASPSVPMSGERHRAWLGVGMAAATALAIYLFLLGRLILPDSAVATVAIAATATPARAAAQVAPAEIDERLLIFPADCTPTRLDNAPEYFREACKTLEHDPQVKTPSPTRPYALTTTRVASNIRSGPDTRFPILTTTPPGARVQLVGYTVNRGYVWYLTNFGGWIRSDLLTESPLYLPMVGDEEMS